MTRVNGKFPAKAEDTCLMLTFEFHLKSSLLSTPFHTFLFLTTNLTLALKDVRK